MKKLFLLFLGIIIAAGAVRSQGNYVPSENLWNAHDGYTRPLSRAEYSREMDDYRRSSLCIVLLTHRGKQYAEDIERIFNNYPIPARYDNHNVASVRVIDVGNQNVNKKTVDNLLRTHKVANKVVAQWFNHNPNTGHMNMDLVHNRGGYNAMNADVLRAMSTNRGTSVLTDEGIDLLSNTYVLVADLDYFDRHRNFRRGSRVLSVLGAVAQGFAEYSALQAQYQYSTGNYSSAYNSSQNARSLGQTAQTLNTASAVVDNMGGFSVKMKAFLYRLHWGQEETDNLFGSMWVDAITPHDEIHMRSRRFANTEYKLDFVGKYKAKSGKTMLNRWDSPDEVIADVCFRSVNQGITALARKFPEFRPKAPFRYENGMIYSRIGTKEDVSYGTRYEIVERQRDSKGRIKWKRVGEIVARSPWNNEGISFGGYFSTEHPGTSFTVRKSKRDLASTQGLQIREMY